MSQQDYDRARLAELRAMEHRALAVYARDIEDQLRRWRDLTLTVKAGTLGLAFAAGAAACAAVQWAL